jgi:hypothetical protein
MGCAAFTQQEDVGPAPGQRRMDAQTAVAPPSTRNRAERAFDAPSRSIGTLKFLLLFGVACMFVTTLVGLAFIGLIVQLGVITG